MRSVYIVYDNGKVEEFGSEEDAHTYISVMQSQDPTKSYTIVKEERYTVKGLGRDPDLH